MSPPILELVRVSRQFAGRTVVQALDLAVARGEVLGLLGVNGAGKTSAMRMMAGALAPDAGHVRLGGRDLAQHPQLARRQVGYLPETPPLHAELTTVEYLRFCARLHGVARGAVTAAVERAIERCQLGEVRRRVIGVLSKGWRQRIGIAQAIVHAPDLIVLDEPASGLDPVQALGLRALVRELGRAHAVVLSTHLLPDVAACCDRVAILHQGRLRHTGPAAVGGGTHLRLGTRAPLTAQTLTSLTPVATAAPLDVLHWRVGLRPGSDAADLAAALVGHGVAVTELRADEPPLEAIFIAIASGEALAA